MKLIELVKHLKSVKESEKFTSTQLSDIEYDLIDMYMIEKVDLDSDILFFDAEKIPNKLILEVEGVTYENLFPLNMAQDMIEEFVGTNASASDLEIAEFIINYRKKDA
ncbi:MULTISPECIES: hypothetical protein [Flavobacterium]|uniref:Uncharacterized protein n=1 Tax=Flavobacterium lipolyticum TaxID=2893754 RepID=A0ABS8M5X8_9FLAO|nr:MULTISPECIES: hypothetical protein [unclassified Flavobacterium]MCC9020219.1 hypothetical protein [Flavobacterium sp. F-126]